MDRTQKAQQVEILKEKFAKANAAFVAEYRGMTVELVTKLRSDVRKGNGEVKVMKNRLARIASKGTMFEGFSDQFKGPVLVAFSYSDPVAVAKAMKENIKEESPFNLKSGSLQGKTLDAKGVDALSKLPDRNTLLATLLGTIRAPLQNFVNVLQATPRDFVNVLGAVKSEKEKKA